MNAVMDETGLIDLLARRFAPAPHRINAVHEADAELVSLPASAGTAGRVLAVTTDTIAEEISAGLYRDPYQAGWTAAMASLSDLAAVGAEPLGILVAETLPDAFPAGELDRLQAGIADGCAAEDTYVLGGDTNFGPALSITTTAIGTVPEGRPTTRRGIEPGDRLFCSGRLGRGNGYALATLAGGPDTPFPGGYYPRARIREGAILRGHASACMDTSDGVFATLDQLAAVNGLGFDIAGGWEDAVDPSSLAVVRRLGLPEWFLLAGCHGEFELIFTVHPRRLGEFLDRASSAGWRPHELGVASTHTGVRIDSGRGPRTFDTARLRRASWRPGATADEIIRFFLAYENESKKGVPDYESGH